jgi:hypothetical protein
MTDLFMDVIYHKKAVINVEPFQLRPIKEEVYLK